MEHFILGLRCGSTVDVVVDHVAKIHFDADNIRATVTLTDGSVLWTSEQAAYDLSCAMRTLERHDRASLSHHMELLLCD